MGGLKKTDLMRSKTGKIVSKKANANGKKAYAHIKGWTTCAEGAQGAWRQRLPGGEEGLAALQEGQGALWPVSTAALERVSPLEAHFTGRPGVWGVPHLARDQWRVPPQHSARIVILYTSFR